MIRSSVCKKNDANTSSKTETGTLIRNSNQQIGTKGETQKDRIEVTSDEHYKEPLNSLLYSQIAYLSVQLQVEKDKVKEYKEKYDKICNELNELKIALKKYMNNDQLQIIKGNQVKKWSSETIQKSIILKQLGGNKVLDFARRFVAPVVSSRALNNIVSDLPVKPGIATFNINILKMLTDNFLPHQLRADIKIDEKSLIPGKSFNHSTGEYVGCVTIPYSNELANNVFVAYLSLMSVRIKMLVGFHFTGKSFNGDLMKLFLCDLIKTVESSTKIKVDVITPDLGPCNCSLANSFGIRLKKYSRDYYTQHPGDESRKLYFNFDPTHNVKNLAGGLRRHDVLIPDFIVKKYKLTSKYARFSEIKKIFNAQSKFKFKPAPLLKKEVINPDHFEVMRESTAFNLINNEVSYAIDFFNSSSIIRDMLQDEEFEIPLSGTSWLLKFFNKYATLMLKTVWTPQNYKENSEWLITEAVPVLETLKFNNAYMKCTTGAVINILTTVDVVGQYFDEGMESLNVEWLSSNAIENFFSQIVHYSSKPSALNFIQAAKSISLCNFMERALDTKIYSWSVENVSICSQFLKILREESAKSSQMENQEINVSLNIPQEINWKSLFKNDLEFNAFCLSMKKIIIKLMDKLNCDGCKSKFMEYSIEPIEGNLLSHMHDKSPWNISTEVQCFFIAMEYVYREIKNESITSSVKFKEIFTDTIHQHLDILFEHCSQTISMLIQMFASFRLKLDNHCREMHIRNKYASKCN